MDVAHPAEQLALGQHLAGAARLQPAVLVGVGDLVAHLGDAQRRQQLLDRALGVEEVELGVLDVPLVEAPLAAQDAGHIGRLVGRALVLVAEEDAAHLVELDVGRTVVQVVGDRAQKARDDGAAHLRLVSDQRVHNLDGDAATLLGHTEALEVARLREAVGGRLGQAAGAQGGADLAQALLLHGEAAGVVAGGRQGRLDVALAVETHDLLDQVDLAGKVGTVGGGGHREVIARALDRAAQTGQALLHEVVLDRGAAQHADAVGAQGDHGIGERRRIHVNHTLTDLGAAALLEEGRRDGGHVAAGVGVDLALVADGGLAHEVQAATGARDVAVVEAGRLQQDVGRALVDLGVEAAHDTGQAHRGLAVVGDDGHVGRERALLLVEGHELLALVRRAHHDVALAVADGELAQVEGVQGLARKEHHIVGDVDDVVDRAGTGSSHAAGQPVGAGADLDVLHDAGRIAAAHLGIIDGDVHEVCHLLGRLVLDGRQLDVGVLVEDGRDLGRHAGHGQAVGAVGGHLAVDHGVADAVPVHEIHAHRRVLRQDHDTGVVGGDAQLAGGAVHAVGLHAAQLARRDLDTAGQLGPLHGHDDVVACMDVRSAADDLQRGGVAVGIRVLLSHGHLADPHVVRVGVTLGGQDLAGHDVLEVGAHLLDRLDLSASADELIDQLLGVIGDVHHRLEPFI